MIHLAQASIIPMNTLEQSLSAGLHKGSGQMRWLFAALNEATCAVP